MPPGTHLLAVAVVAAATAAPATAASGDRPAILSVVVNGVGVGDQIVVLRERDALVPVDALRRGGLVLTGRVEQIDGVPYVALSSVPVRADLDEEHMSLQLTAGVDDLVAHGLDLAASRRPEGLVYHDARSLFVNYGVHAVDTAVDGFVESGLRAGPGLLYGAVTWMAGHAPVRGLTNLTLDGQGDLRQLVIGDRVVNAGPLAGGGVIGGIHAIRSFALDPYLVISPSIDLSASVLLPSTAQIYVNGVLVRTEQIAPGRFSLSNLPVTTGAGDARVVLTDALGRQVDLVQDYYQPGSLLRPGLSDYEVVAGALRQNLGIDSFSYGAPAAIVRYARGITSRLSGGFHADATSEQTGAGGSLTAGLPLGQIDLAAAVSTDRGARGAAASAAWSYTSRRGSVAVFGQIVSDRYATIEVDRALDRVIRQGRAQGTLSLGHQTALGAQLTAIETRDGGWSRRSSLQLSTVPARGYTLSITVGRDEPWQQASSYDAMMSVSANLTDRTRGSITHQQHGSVRDDEVELHRSLGGQPGIGYRALVGIGGDDRALVAGQGLTQFGRYDASYTWDHQRGGTVDLAAAGGIAVIGGRVFAAPPIDQSFALVRVPGVAGVGAMLENHLVGHTDDRGDVFLPSLQPRYGNKVAIVAADLPFDHQLPSARQVVAPPAGGGVIVTFEAPELHLVRGKLTVRGTIPAYGALRVGTGVQPFVSPIGSEGGFELDGLLEGRHPAVIEWEGGRCELELVVPADHQPIIDVGAHDCVAPGAGR